MDRDTIIQLCNSAERQSQIALSLHQLHVRDGREDLGGLAWVLHVEASAAKEILEAELGDG